MAELPPETVAAFIALTDIDGPWWGVRDDYNAALVAWRAGLRAGSTESLEDCRIRWGKDDEPKQLTFEDMFRAYGGKV